MSTPGFDPYSPSFLDDPYPTYARLRAVGRSFFSEEWGVNFFTHHSDVTAILKDRRFGRDVRHAVPVGEIDPGLYNRIYPPHYPSWTRYVRDSFIDLEPPAHTRIRRLVQHAFTRRAANSYRPRLEAAARSLLDVACARGELDAIADFATPIPLAMISELFGSPTEDQPQLVDWSHAIVRLFDKGCTDEEGQRAEQATKDFVAYLSHLIDSKEGTEDNLVTALEAAEIDSDRLTRHEIVATAILTLNAGHEATVQAIGNGLLALSGDPIQYDLLRSRPDLLPSAVNELMRFDTPLQMFERWVLEDVEWAGVELGRGTKVGLLFGAANHDEGVFDSPDRLDLSRDPNPHVSLGAGIHYCVGAPLAQVEMEVAFAEFAARVRTFEVTADQLERLPSLVFRGVHSLPLAIDPA